MSKPKEFEQRLRDEPDHLGLRGMAPRPSSDATPLPPAVPYHVADPTSIGTLPRSALPPSLREELDSSPQIAEIAGAARQISEALIATSPADDEADEGDSFDHDTRRIQRSGAAEPAGRFAPPAMVELGEGDGDPMFLPADGVPRAPSGDDEESMLSPASGVPHALGGGDARAALRPARGVPRRIIDDEKTARRELPSRVRPPVKE